MGLNLNINYILRTDQNFDIKIGKTYKYTKEGLHFITDTIPIWLTKKDWTPLAEIIITSQSRKDNETKIEFKVLYIYNLEEQKLLHNILLRMYGWK